MSLGLSIPGRFFPVPHTLPGEEGLGPAATLRPWPAPSLSLLSSASENRICLFGRQLRSLFKFKLKGYRKKKHGVWDSQTLSPFPELSQALDVGPGVLSQLPSGREARTAKSSGPVLLNPPHSPPSLRSQILPPQKRRIRIKAGLPRWRSG